MGLGLQPVDAARGSANGPRPRGSGPAMIGAAALAGGVAMTSALLIAYPASVTGLPFPAIALGQAIVEALPGAISIPLIEILQHWAQRLLVLGVLALFLLDGVADGVLAVRR